MEKPSEVPFSDVSESQRLGALATLSVQARKMLEPLSRLRGLEALASGARKPNTPAQAHFVKVVEGEVPPTGAYERAFLRYSAALRQTFLNQTQAPPGSPVEAD